jgi:hypothetical protein
VFPGCFSEVGHSVPRSLHSVVSIFFGDFYEHCIMFFYVTSQQDPSTLHRESNWNHMMTER